jgi:hypothetical protein
MTTGQAGTKAVSRHKRPTWREVLFRVFAEFGRVGG